MCILVEAIPFLSYCLVLHTVLRQIQSLLKKCRSLIYAKKRFLILIRLQVFLTGVIPAALITFATKHSIIKVNFDKNFTRIKKKSTLRKGKLNIDLIWMIWIYCHIALK